MNRQIALLTFGLVISSTSALAAVNESINATTLEFDQLQGVMAVSAPADRVSVPGMTDPEMND